MVTDLNNNPVNHISTTAALMASEVIPDMFPPELEAFDLNLGTSVLTLVWSKPVQVSSLAVTGIRIQRSSSSTDNSVLLASDSTTESPDGAIIEIKLAFQDSTTLKQQSVIATSRENTYISISSGIVVDAIRNRPSNGILSTSALLQYHGPQMGIVIVACMDMVIFETRQNAHPWMVYRRT